MKYKAAIFDLFGTLVRSFPDADSHAVLNRMAEVLSVPPADFIGLWNDIFDMRIRGLFKKYQDTLSFICQQMDVPVNEEKLDIAAGIRLEMTKQEVMSSRDGAVETLSALHKRGYRIGLLSDCSMETTIILKDSPLAGLIDKTVFSCKEGMRKPDKRLFMLACERLGVSPEECVYVADGMVRELATASELGMYAVRINVPGENEDSPYREEWNGPQISSLKEVLNLVE